MPHLRREHRIRPPGAAGPPAREGAAEHSEAGPPARAEAEVAGAAYHPRKEEWDLVRNRRQAGCCRSTESPWSAADALNVAGNAGRVGDARGHPARRPRPRRAIGASVRWVSW